MTDDHIPPEVSVGTGGSHNGNADEPKSLSARGLTDEQDGVTKTTIPAHGIPHHPLDRKPT